MQTRKHETNEPLYAPRVLRVHDLRENTLQTIFRAIVVAKQIYRSSAWWGFASATNHQKLEAFIRRSIHAWFYYPDPNYSSEELYNEA